MYPKARPILIVIVKQHYSAMPSLYFNKVLKLLYIMVSHEIIMFMKQFWSSFGKYPQFVFLLLKPPFHQILTKNDNYLTLNCLLRTEDHLSLKQDTYL